MPLEFDTITESVRNLLDKNNVTTSSFDISSGLATRVTDVVIGDPKIKPVININYPIIMVKLNSDRSEFAQMGDSARRNEEVEFEINAITFDGLGHDNSTNDSMNEIYKLTGNIAKLFRNFVQLSQTTVLWSQVTDTDFSPIKNEATYCQVGKILLGSMYLTT